MEGFYIFYGINILVCRYYINIIREKSYKTKCYCTPLLWIRFPLDSMQFLMALCSATQCLKNTAETRGRKYLNGERNVLTLGSQVSSIYPGMCIQSETKTSKYIINTNVQLFISFYSICIFKQYLVIAHKVMH